MKNRPDRNSPEILLITSYPPRECGIATYSQDLLKAMSDKFHQSFNLKVCALEAGPELHNYPSEVSYVWDTSDPNSHKELPELINQNARIKLVLIQHEFGFFENIAEHELIDFLHRLKKPVVLAFHTVLPRPGDRLKMKIEALTAEAKAVIVMTRNAAQILTNEYGVPSNKISVIPHGVHLVPHHDRSLLKQKYGFHDRKVLATFGLISSGKSIETTLDALPAVVVHHPSVLFLVIGKTHPSIVKQEGEQYRQMLEKKVEELNLQNHVKFINVYVPLQELLEYLLLTDIYLFTSKDPNQAVSGTFSYALSCGCAIISTPIPHAMEVLKEDSGVLTDFQNPAKLAGAINHLLGDDELRGKMTRNGYHRALHSAWENAAIGHARLFKNVLHNHISLKYTLPPINLDHVKKMTTSFGIIQFSKLHEPDLGSGFTLDDNARALIAMCMHHEVHNGWRDLVYIKIYLDFIAHCQQPNGSFMNYVDESRAFTKQNKEVNLEDANGRAIWALGFLVATHKTLPESLVYQAEGILKDAISQVEKLRSPRGMAFAIKGLHYYLTAAPSPKMQRVLEILADRLVQMYREKAEPGWNWFEDCLTYGNSVMPEALLCAWLSTGNTIYHSVARQSFNFLLKHIFVEDGIKVICNDGWMQKNGEKGQSGEQPIDVAYTILALRHFYEVFNDDQYHEKMITAMNWFLGQNHLNQIIYNPCTGGCYDGLEKDYVNMNQGAESTVCYLMARLAFEKPMENNMLRFRIMSFLRDVQIAKRPELLMH